MPTLKTVFELRRVKDLNDDTVIEVTNRLTDETAVAELHVIGTEI
jgi:hypothetical protein